MKKTFSSNGVLTTSGFPVGGALLLWTISFLLLGVVSAWGENTRTQTIQLEKGWNAIWLAVEPSDSDPAVLFADTTVDVVATYDAAGASGQFSTDPAVDMLRLLGWGIWYAPSREDAFLSDIGSIYGGKSYLIHAQEAFTLSVEGRVVWEDAYWTPNAFNLVGYTLDQVAPPTFSQFFNASEAHRGQVIYRLIHGVWSQVQNPATTLMRDGEAFWVYCNGASKFSGPLSVETKVSSGLSLMKGKDDLVLRNMTDHPVEPTIEHIPAGTDYVPLAVVIHVIGESNLSYHSVPVSMGDGAWSQTLPALEAGAAIRVPLQLRGDVATASEMKSLICVKTDLGTETWVPVTTGQREDVK